MNTVQFGVLAPQFSHKSGQRPKFQAQQPVHFGAEPKKAEPSRSRPILIGTMLLGLLGAGVTAVTDNPVSRMFKSSKVTETAGQTTEASNPALCSHEPTTNSGTVGLAPVSYTFGYNFGELSTLNMFPGTRDGRQIAVRLHLNCDALVESALAAEGVEPLSGADNKTKDDYLARNVRQVAYAMSEPLETYVSQRDHAAIDEQQLTEALMPRLREQLAERGIAVDGVLSLELDLDPKEVK